MTIRQRIAELCAMKPDELGAGISVVEVPPLFAEKVARALEAADLGGFFIYPTPEGGLQFEWPNVAHELVINP